MIQVRLFGGRKSNSSIIKPRIVSGTFYLRKVYLLPLAFLPIILLNSPVSSLFIKFSIILIDNKLFFEARYTYLFLVLTTTTVTSSYFILSLTVLPNFS